MRIRQMTYAGQKEVFEEERGQIGPAVQARFSINGQRLLAHRAFARLAELGDGLVPQPLELEQRDLTFGRREPPFVELTIDGNAQAGQHVLRVLTPPPRLGPGLGQFEIEPCRPPPRRRHLPPVQRDARERRHKNQQLESLQRERYAAPVFDRQVGRHQDRDQREDGDGRAPAGNLEWFGVE
jgi:hypothetical protein